MKLNKVINSNHVTQRIGMTCRVCAHVGRKYIIFGLIVFILLITLHLSQRRFDSLLQNYLTLFQSTLELSQGSREMLSTSSFNYQNSWKPMMTIEPKFQIYSAFFDPRLDIVEKLPNNSPDTLPIGSVRVISIIPQKVNTRNFYCHFKYTHGMIMIKTIQALKVYAMQEHKGMTYSPFFIVCPLEQDIAYQQIMFPESIGVTYGDDFNIAKSFIYISYPRDADHVLDIEPKNGADKLAVCVAPAHHNYSNGLRVVEFVEIYKLLGASKFYFYNTSISSDVNDIFEFYKTEKVAEIAQWDLNGFKFEVDLHYDGIMGALNDCVYHATFVDNFKYVVIVDFDEILIPLKKDTKTLLDLLSIHDTDALHSFNFQGVFFFYHFEANFSNVPNDAVNKFLYTQALTKRIVRAFGRHNRSKFIVKGRMIEQVGNHFVWESIKNSAEYSIKLDEGLLFHYREECIFDVCNEPIMEDDRARLYGNKLWENVERVCHKLFHNGKCPMYHDDMM